MRHYAARQRADSLRWCYTVDYGGLIQATGYCAGDFDTLWPEPPEDAESLLPPTGFFGWDEYRKWREKYSSYRDKFHGDGHATADEAQACYREYLLDHRVNYDLAGRATTQHSCQHLGCDGWTHRAVLLDNTHFFWLCDEHRNRNEIAALAPAVGESWAS